MHAHEEVIRKFHQIVGQKVVKYDLQPREQLTLSLHDPTGVSVVRLKYSESYCNNLKAPPTHTSALQCAVIKKYSNHTYTINQDYTKVLSLLYQHYSWILIGIECALLLISILLLFLVVCASNGRSIKSYAGRLVPHCRYTDCWSSGGARLQLSV